MFELAGAGLRIVFEQADRAVDDEIGRDHADARVVADHFVFLIEHGGECRQPRQVGVGVGLVVDGVLAVEEVGHVLVRTAELADDVGHARAAVAVIVALVGDLGGGKVVVDDVVADGVVAGETVAADGFEALQLVGVAGLVARELRQRTVAELRLLPGARAGIEAERGGEFGRARQRLVHEGVVELVQLGRLVGAGGTAGRRGRVLGAARKARHRHQGGRGGSRLKHIPAIEHPHRPFPRKPPSAFKGRLYFGQVTNSGVLA